MTTPSDITLRCANRDMLERLYHRHLKASRLILPVKSTNARGRATISVVMPDKSRVVLRAKLEELESETGAVLRATFPPLKPVQVKAIERQLELLAGPARSTTLQSMRRPELPEMSEPEPESASSAPPASVERQVFTPPPRSSTMPSPRFPTAPPASSQPKRRSK